MGKSWDPGQRLLKVRLKFVPVKPDETGRSEFLLGRVLQKKGKWFLFKKYFYSDFHLIWILEIDSE